MSVATPQRKRIAEHPVLKTAPSKIRVQVPGDGLVVHTQAKDAPGIARDIHRSLIAQANSGPV
jgi:hypothetical protein